VLQGSELSVDQLRVPAQPVQHGVAHPPDVGAAISAHVEQLRRGHLVVEVRETIPIARSVRSPSQSPATPAPLQVVEMVGSEPREVVVGQGVVEAREQGVTVFR
jgi:hypothetical protein